MRGWSKALIEDVTFSKNGGRVRHLSCDQDQGGIL